MITQSIGFLQPLLAHSSVELLRNRTPSGRPDARPTDPTLWGMGLDPPVGSLGLGKGRHTESELTLDFLVITK